MRYKRYVVAQNDTLELLAQTYLGDMSRAAEIARLNHLRYPFIADDPQARLATPLGTTTLASALLNGQVLAVQHADPAIFPDGGLVLLRGVGGVQGQPYWDVLTILGTARGVGGQGPVFSPGLSGKTVFAGVPLAPGMSPRVRG